MKKAIVVMVALAALVGMQSVASANVSHHRSTGVVASFSIPATPPATSPTGTVQKVSIDGITTHGGLWE